ncbi:hypothetical protein CGRA01v4_05010 [Colletotrichum graminicola]|nr:hypothetical protein CGRA01v4_05010 [Colletotrichum graminicola]
MMYEPFAVPARFRHVIHGERLNTSMYPCLSSRQALHPTAHRQTRLHRSFLASRRRRRRRCRCCICTWIQ